MDMDMNLLLGAAAGAAATAVCLRGSASGSAAAAAAVGGQDDDPLIVEAVDWAAAHGMLVRPQGTQFDHCPFSLLPTPLPRKAFEAARTVK